jgi:hypothetical protein
LLIAAGVTGVATSSAEARGGAAVAAAKKGGKAALAKANRMKAKMAQRPEGNHQQKSQRRLQISKRQLRRAMSNRQLSGNKGNETKRAREAFARDRDKPRRGPALRFRWQQKRSASR